MYILQSAVWMTFWRHAKADSVGAGRMGSERAERSEECVVKKKRFHQKVKSHSLLFKYILSDQVDGIVQTDVFASSHSLFDDEVGAGNEVAQFGEFFGEDAAVVEFLRFAEDEVEAVESAS